MMSGQHLARPESQACPPQIKHQMRTAPATTLQRSHATAGQQHPGHHRPAPAMTAPSEHVAFGAAADHRGRASAEPGAQRPGMSPGKENRPLPSSRGASPTREPAPATSKSPLLGISLGRSKGKPSNKNESTQKQQNGSGPRSRSVSPSKRFKGKLKGGHDDSGNAAAQVNTSAAYPRSAREVDNEFIGMLGEMQVPNALLQKLIHLDSRVKESMLKGQASLTLASLAAATGSASGSTSAPAASSTTARSRPALPDFLRKSKSTATLTEGDGLSGSMDLPAPQSRASLFGEPSQSRTPSGGSSSSGGQPSYNSLRGQQSTNASSTSLAQTRSRTASFSSYMPGSSGSGATGGPASAVAFATMLKANDTSRLDIARVKRMRAVLSSESPIWLTEFFDEGGFMALLGRLKELLDMEWRTEQHDDNLLHELLRCFVALSSTACGRETLASTMPTPFHELSSLLFSEKRPGDLSTRKLLVDLLYILADLPGPALPAALTQDARSQRVTSSLSAPVDAATASVDTSPHFSLLLSLLHNPRDVSKEALVDFISASHTPRPFKAFVTELLNVNRDYFWVFCHGTNRFWALRDINISEVQGPKVPGGMTGGVEFEAMAYQTALMRLMNLLASRIGRIARKEGPAHLAHDFHALLFSSGMERALAITRKASQTYYQPLHLELSRYFDYARRANFRIPSALDVYQSAPHVLHIAAQHTPSDRPRQAFPPQSTQHQPEACGQKRAREADGSGEGSDRAHHPLTTSGADLSAGGALSPHSHGAAPLSPAVQATAVGNAVRWWEQRAGPHAAASSPVGTSSTGKRHPQQGHLGLGWAPAA